jgi:peroxiredoxin family protein
LKNHQKLVLRFKLLSANTIAITINQTVSFYLLVNIFFGIIGLSFLLQENLSSINILKILIDGGGGDLVERYNETQNISDMDRQEIVRIIMADLTNKTGNLYPSSEMKERTAKALVEFFPWLSIHRSYTALPFFQLPDRRIF